MLCEAIILAGLAISSPSKPDGDDPIDTIAIEGIVVNSKLQRFSSTLSLKLISTAELKQSKQLLVSDLLGSLSNVTLNNYGPGGIALASLRGLGTFHTAVLWNGINLQSSMNGNVNLSSIPVNFVDQIAVQYGGNGALFGSGAIGGAIHLDNNLDFGKGHSTEVYQTYGSFNSIFSGINYTYSGSKFASSTRIFYSEAENDFRFHNITKIGKPYENQENSNSNKIGLLQNISSQISPKDNVSASIWYQNSFNRFPPMMTSSSNHDKENLEFIRGTLQWKTTTKKVDYSVKGGLIKDSQFYRNPGTGEVSNHYSNSGIFETEAILKISSTQKLETGLNFNAEDIRTTNYPEVKKRFRPAISAAYRFSNLNGKFEAFVGFRDEMVNGVSAPLTWSAGSKIKLFNNLSLRANLSKNYRIPTMNDLYWTGWGNPNLKPEVGYGEELGLDFMSRVDSQSFIAKLNAFNNNVNDWIIWMPNGSVWTPQNTKKVWARGIDISLNFTKNIQHLVLGVDLMGTTTLSTNQKSAAESANTIGKQLPYIPKIKASSSLYLGYKSFNVKYSQSYTGKRYTTADNSLQIDPFSIANISIEKTFEGKSFSIKSFFRIENIWNEEYQVMAYYPMPLRNYQIGVSILFNKPIH